MKGLLRNVLVYAFALFIASYALDGLRIVGGFETYLLAGLILTVLFALLKPVLSLIALPFNLASFGLFSIFINMIILYILTILIPQVRISSFVFPGFSFAGITLSKIALNTFLAYLVMSLFISGIISGVKWLFNK